jgi:hypothetical protein
VGKCTPPRLLYDSRGSYKRTSDAFEFVYFRLSSVTVRDYSFFLSLISYLVLVASAPIVACTALLCELTLTLVQGNLTRHNAIEVQGRAPFWYVLWATGVEEQ